MRNFFSSAATIIGGSLFVAVIVGGWALYGMYRDQVPAPIRGVLDMVQGGGPVVQPYAPVAAGADAGQQADPLADCPDFGSDSATIVAVMDGTDPAVQARVEKGTSLIGAQLEEANSGRVPALLEQSGAADALRTQADYLSTTAAALRSTGVETQEAASLAVSMAAAIEKMAQADERLLGSGAGIRTRLQWLDYARRVSGPATPIQAISAALLKCPHWMRADAGPAVRGHAMTTSRIA